MQKFRLSLCGLAAGLAAGLAPAQTPPSAGSLLQQIEQGRTNPLPNRGAPQALPLPEPMPAFDGVTVTVTTFRFAGNHLLGNEELTASVAPFLHRPLSFAQLQEAVAAVAQAYRQAGWVVRTYLPRQEIKDGVVTVQIVEAVFGAVRPAPDSTSPVPFARMAPYITAAQASGAPLKAEQIDRALLLLGDVPGVAAHGSLQAGAHEGETDVLLKLDSVPLLKLDVGADNTGAPSTGTRHYNANLNLFGPFERGDQIGALIHFSGSDYARLGATMPLGFDGWRAGANASYLKYSLVGPDFASLQASGNSTTGGLEASYPLLRSQLKNVYFAFNLDDKRFDNDANGATTSKYRVDTASAALNGNLFDNFGGGGANSWNLALEQGRVDLDGSPNQAQDAASTRVGGAFTKLKYMLTRQQVISDTWSLYAALSGQAAGKNLDSSEKFYLGGPSGVRAYPGGEGGGSDGQLFNLELRARLPHDWSASGFYDLGHVTINHDNDFAGAAGLNSYSLKGAGLGLTWQGASGLNFKASWARRIGANPNPTATGADQDGTLIKNRFWVQGGYPF